MGSRKARLRFSEAIENLTFNYGSSFAATYAGPVKECVSINVPPCLLLLFLQERPGGILMYRSMFIYHRRCENILIEF